MIVWLSVSEKTIDSIQLRPYENRIGRMKLRSYSDRLNTSVFRNLEEIYAHEHLTFGTLMSIGYWEPGLLAYARVEGRLAMHFFLEKKIVLLPITLNSYAIIAKFSMQITIFLGFTRTTCVLYVLLHASKMHVK